MDGVEEMAREANNLTEDVVLSEEECVASDNK